jgi:ribose transport system substrate-binding protein
MSRLNLIGRFLVVGCVLAAVFVACGRHQSSERYLLVTNNSQIPYWQQAAAGFSDTAGQLKVQAEVVGPASFDPRAEQAALREATREKPSGILLHAAEPALLTFEIDEAIGAGIPVITIDADAPASKRLFFIGTNNLQAGTIGGERLAQELKGKGNVVFFTIAEQTNLVDRLLGYREALLRYPQIHVVRVVDIGGNPDVASATVNDMMARYPDEVDAFVCLEALAGRNVASTLAGRRIQRKVVMAMDTDPDTLDWIERGVIVATIAQKPYTMAAVGLRMLAQLHRNPPSPLDQAWSNNSFSQVPAFVDTGSFLVDKSNVAAFRASLRSPAH